ncbi:MAG: polysaccharide biosynthesis tyrosine autokinase [Fusicatenibacter sp.]|nr:polysaccharide biosynthesis tyrosine autokinase [Fusicatenibacter sp.]
MQSDNRRYGGAERSALDLRSILRDLGRSWWMILLLSLAAAMLTYSAISVVHKPEYTVSTTFAVTTKGTSVSDFSNISTANSIAQKFSAILGNNILKKKVAAELNMSSFDARMNVSIVPESNLMVLSVTADSPQKAFQVLKSVLRNYPEVSDYVLPDLVLETLQQPEISGTPSNQLNVTKYMSYAFLLTMMCIIALITALSCYRDTVKNEREFTQKVDGDLLGTIWHEKKKKKSTAMVITNPTLSFRYVESNRMMASRVKGRMDKKNAKVVMVTSVVENEGKSTVAANLALALAQEQHRVLLIDCDFRKPALYKIFEYKGKMKKDLADVIMGKETFEGLLKVMQNPKFCIAFTYHSLNSSTEIISNGSLNRILEICRKSMDYIILDTPPMGLVADAEEIVKLSDAAILTVRQDMVLTRDINDAIDALNQEEEKVLGCVFSNAYPQLGERVGKTSYGYGNYNNYGNYSKADR